MAPDARPVPSLKSFEFIKALPTLEILLLCEQLELLLDDGVLLLLQMRCYGIGRSARCDRRKAEGDGGPGTWRCSWPLYEVRRSVNAPLLTWAAMRSQRPVLLRGAYPRDLNVVAAERGMVRPFVTRAAASSRARRDPARS